MFVPGTRAIDIAVERDWALACERLQFIDQFPADCTEIGWPGLDRNTGALTFTGEIEKVSDDVLNAVHSAFDNRRMLFHCGIGIGCILNMLVVKVKGQEWAEDWGVPFCAGLVVGEGTLALITSGIILYQGYQGA